MRGDDFMPLPRNTLPSKTNKNAIILSSIVACTLSLIAMNTPLFIYLTINAIIFVSWFSFTQLCIINVAKSKQKYNAAWENIVVPKMISSITNFQHLSNNLTENITQTPKYTQMYLLSQEIQQEIQRGPILNADTNFDAPLNFSKLNTMMEHYKSNHTN